MNHDHGPTKMNSANDAFHTLARRTLGPVTAQARANLPAHIRAFADSNDRHYLAKQHSSRERYEREVHAYTRWVPAIHDLAPHLVATDPDHLILLLTAVPGVPASNVTPGGDAERAAHHAAGTVLRRLHDSAPPDHSLTMAATLAKRTRHWVGRAGALLTTAQRRLLLDHADAIASTAVEVRFCHLDFQPRNWIIDDDRTLRLIDYEHARPDARVRDMARLAHRYWPRRPDLYHAFIGGYGTALDQGERRLLHHFGALEAATALVRGTDTGNPDISLHGRTLLDRLMRHPDPSPELWSTP
jgi:tRNA A-37 threonylcarbamoyl transferase component Bud32